MAVSAAFSRLLPCKQAFSPPDLRGFTPPPTPRKAGLWFEKLKRFNFCLEASLGEWLKRFNTLFSAAIE
jgi:hypothetical protein